VLGGSLECVLSGGAPLHPDSQHFVNAALSCPLVQGYGLTETSGGATLADGACQIKNKQTKNCLKNHEKMVSQINKMRKNCLKIMVKIDKKLITKNCKKLHKNPKNGSQINEIAKNSLKILKMNGFL
jgi:acyl-coenzyme A synthetase/AMP-(fatty) acid ligase